MTHDFKFATVYDLPFGKGQKYLTKGPAAWVLGNWRISSINLYASGTPVAVTTSNTLPIYASGRPGLPRVRLISLPITAGSQATAAGFNPGKDTFFVPYRHRCLVPHSGFAAPR